ncbi:unknown protein [Microcystis aeruginosa NIES-843]|uniref:Uncharacterized protein n=1 Tax=Microcystis aeruginosa (strain NIES-843 / IAM M-2473) TaxID=449447 RepID=B0JRL1_MICAN|nr:unknown protein [Microcystis aeruginosa NIES-843]
MTITNFILTFGRNCYRFLSYQLFQRSALNYFSLIIGLLNCLFSGRFNNPDFIRIFSTLLGIPSNVIWDKVK